MRFTNKQVVAMVVAVCAAVVLAPVGVLAATGQLVTLVDPVLDRKVRVGSGGTLQVESRAGSMSGAFSTLHENITDVTGHSVWEVNAPGRIAITEVTLTLRGDNTASTNHVRVYSRVRTSGTASCQNGTGWTTPKTLRTYVVRAGSTVQALFNGPPLVSQAGAAGQRVCIAFQQTKWTGSTELDVGLTGYSFS